MNSMLPDNGGSRSGLNQRNFSYAVHIPERRLDRDRRSGLDRRNPEGFKWTIEKDRRGVFRAT